MDRLTKRNFLGNPVFKDGYECDRCGEPTYRLPDLGNGSPTAKLCEYEDLEEKGMLIKLPAPLTGVESVVLELDGVTWKMERVYDGEEKANIDDFNHEAMENRMRYADAQVRETLSMIEPFSVPKGYSKIGDRKKPDGMVCANTECVYHSEEPCYAWIGCAGYEEV